MYSGGQMSSLINRITTNFTQVSNSVVTDARLSFKAKGLYLYLASKPDGWKFYLTEIQKNATDGRDGIKTAFKELETLGYLVRSKVNGEDGKFTYNYEITDSPSVVLPSVDFPTVVKPTPSNIKLNSNTNNSNTNNISSAKKPKAKKKFQKPTLEEVTAYCSERGKGVDPVKWYNHYESNGWKVGRNKMVNWKSAIVTWEKNSGGFGNSQQPTTANRYKKWDGE